MIIYSKIAPLACYAFLKPFSPLTVSSPVVLQDSHACSQYANIKIVRCLNSTIDIRNLTFGFKTQISSYNYTFVTAASIINNNGKDEIEDKR